MVTTTPIAEETRAAGDGEAPGAGRRPGTTGRTVTAGKTAETAVPAARIEHVSKSFATPAGQQLVLDDITLDVAPGEFVTLLGASGCGKSTLLNLVAGLDPAP
ncbi:ATP-binding cassette domain-containing protein, partial [Streptomyces sp. NPDC006967]|uniref:ATP-binding cassette domain-containing protein n=1 Tax=Streptomyces sp. NPDC006967 TaxID=3156906 RepID=UPI0034012B57